MGSPTTTLDTRFSDPGAVPTAWEETVSALECCRVVLDHHRPS